MAQHFLSSSASRTLSVIDVARLSEEEAREICRLARWPATEGRPVCPFCEHPESYSCKSRPGWKCKGCRRKYTVTSGTLFSARKLPLRDLLLAVSVFVNGANGVSALHMSRTLNCTPKTAFVLCHKLREAMASTMKNLKLGGAVELDGAFFGGHLEGYNKIDQRTGKLMRRRRWGERRVVVVMREKQGRTIPFVVDRESGALFKVRRHLAPGAVVHVDQAHAWDSLKSLTALMRVDHKRGFSMNGACTNQAESYFALLRRKQLGVHHRMSGRLLHQYAAELAWRQDNRRLSNGSQFKALLGTALQQPISDEWAGYWQLRGTASASIGQQSAAIEFEDAA